MGTVLDVEDLAVERGGRRVLSGVRFALDANEVLVVVGPNGAGKTTLLDALAGALPSRGRVRFAGGALEGFRAKAAAMAVLPDAAEPPAEVSVRSLVRFFESRGGSPARSTLGIDALLDARCGELSRGEKRRLLLYGTLCAKRPVTLLDEPLGVFDPLQVRSVIDALRVHARTVGALIASVHGLADAERLADRVLILSAGAPVALGTLDALRANAGAPAASLEDVFIALLRQGSASAAA